MDTTKALWNWSKRLWSRNDFTGPAQINVCAVLLFFLIMNSTDAFTQPMAAACPLCGQPAKLPRLSAEELLFRCSRGLPVAAAMPDGSMAVALAGVIYVVPADEWTRALAMRAA